MFKPDGSATTTLLSNAGTVPVNYTFIAGNSTTLFYSPIIQGDINFEAFF